MLRDVPEAEQGGTGRENKQQAEAASTEHIHGTYGENDMQLINRTLPEPTHSKSLGKLAGWVESITFYDEELASAGVPERCARPH